MSSLKFPQVKIAELPAAIRNLAKQRALEQKPTHTEEDFQKYTVDQLISFMDTDEGYRFWLAQIGWLKTKK